MSPRFDASSLNWDDAAACARCETIAAHIGRRRARSGAFEEQRRETSKSINGRELGFRESRRGTTSPTTAVFHREGPARPYDRLGVRYKAVAPSARALRRAVHFFEYLHHHMSPRFESPRATWRFSAPHRALSPESQSFAAYTQVSALRTLCVWSVKTKSPARAGVFPTEEAERAAARGFPHPDPHRASAEGLLC